MEKEEQILKRAFVFVIMLFFTRRRSIHPFFDNSFAVIKVKLTKGDNHWMWKKEQALWNTRTNQNLYSVTAFTYKPEQRSINTTRASFEIGFICIVPRLRTLLMTKLKYRIKIKALRQNRRERKRFRHEQNRETEKRLKSLCTKVKYKTKQNWKCWEKETRGKRSGGPRRSQKLNVKGTEEHERERPTCIQCMGESRSRAHKFSSIDVTKPCD